MMCPSSAFQRFVNLSMGYAIYTFEKQYTWWEAVFPGNFVPVLISEGNCLHWRARPAHLGGHLPLATLGEGAPGAVTMVAHSLYPTSAAFLIDAIIPTEEIYGYNHHALALDVNSAFYSCQWGTQH